MSGTLRRALRSAAGPSKPDPIFGARPRGELQFLPAALEIIETPPPPLPRLTSLAIAALLISAIAWASIGQVDVISTATGRLVPAGGGKVIQPLETASVNAIRVHDGQYVRKGDVLVELEPTETRADVDQLTGELAAAQLEVARLEAVAGRRPFVAPPGADPAAAAVAAREARAEVEETAAKVGGLDRQVQQHEAELASAKAEADRLRALAPLASQRAEVFRSLQAEGYGTKLQAIEAEEKVQDAQRSLDVEQHRAPELQAEIAATQRDRDEAAAEGSKTALAALTDAKVKAASLADELTKALQHLQERTLASPVDGTVQELSIHTVGGVVQPGQMLMRVAPADAPLIVEARLQNRDVGFVEPGMAADVKVETFPFTRYGVVPATVLTVSRDALEPADAGSGRSMPGGGAPSEEPPQYLVRLALGHTSMRVDGREVTLEPGMAVTCEIKTGRRRIISYVLSPLAKAAHDAGRER